MASTGMTGYMSVYNNSLSVEVRQRPQLLQLLPGQVFDSEAGHAQGHFPLPKHLVIQCEARATRLNRWSWEVGG